MPFYENTIVAKQDLSEKDLVNLKEKYKELINNSFGKVIKVEDWGLLRMASKIQRYKKGFYLHYKFEGDEKTLSEFKKKIKIDSAIIRHLVVKYKKLDTEREFFNKKNEKKK